MTDLLSRLRRPTIPTSCKSTCLEAAQEIERLSGPGNATQAQLDAVTKPLHMEIEQLTADGAILRGLLNRFMACRNENGTGWKMSAGANAGDAINKVYLDAKKYLRIETGVKP